LANGRNGVAWAVQFTYRLIMVANHLPQCRVDGFAVHAVIGNGAVHGPDDIGANHHRVDGRAVHPTGHVPVDPASNHHRTMQWCGVDGTIHVPVDPASNHHRTMLFP